MKLYIGAFILILSQASQAQPCFHAGDYEGRGFAWDETRRETAYEVRSKVLDDSNVTSTYNFGTKSFSYDLKTDGTNVFLDGNAASSGTALCGFVSQNIKFEVDGITIDENWTFIGNYLIRAGSKVSADENLRYQELLIRK